MSSESSAQPRIAIIGGGMGGLALLLILHHRGVIATLYEGDTAGFNVRAHLSDTLDLRWKSGLRALRENGPQKEFEKMSRPEADGMRICDGTGKLYLKLGREGEEHGAPRRVEDIRVLEIDRTDFRKLFLDTIPPHSLCTL